MNILSTVSFSTYSERDLLSFILSKANDSQYAAALWRLPDSDITQLILSEQSQSIDRDEFLEELDPGFLFAPFDRTAKRTFLKADHLFTFTKGKFIPQESPEGETTSQWLAEQLASFSPTRYSPPPVEFPKEAGMEKKAFLDIVDLCVKEIVQGTLEKIVPSRIRTIELPPAFDVIEAFQKLCVAYPQALISFVTIPGVGNWLGASPEVLVRVEDKSVFRTVALAGTLPYQPGVDLRSVAWTQKEIEEQALVERYVISCFKKVRLREYEEHGPRTVIAGNLMHLKSEFTVDIKATNFPQIGTVMLDLLHPTSAVCGMPLEPSLDFLRRHEPHDRGFYAGYLGPVNIRNNIDLFVNLRCMQIGGAFGRLYAGAGVTIDSIPEKEWDETEIKFNTLLNVVL